jgi:hypothetical protein
MARLKGLLVWTVDQDPGAFGDLLADDAELVVSPLGTGGQVPAGLPAFDQVLILVDWACLTPDPAIVERWRRTLAPAAVAVIVTADRARLTEAAPVLASQPIDDFLERPWHPALLHRKVRTTFR